MPSDDRRAGYYWIKRHEPDGPPEWEPAKYSLHHYQAGVVNPPDMGPCWYVIGDPHPRNPPRNSNASNAWKIGGPIERDALPGEGELP